MVDRINKGKLKARCDGKRWLVHSSLAPPSEEDSGSQAETERQLPAAIELLKGQIKQLHIIALQLGSVVSATNDTIC